MLWIVGSTLVLSNALLIAWCLVDKNKLLYDVFSAIIYGLLTWWIITYFYRRKDSNEKISRSMYGLQIYLLKIKTKVEDLIDRDTKKLRDDKWADLSDKLRDTLIEEPYELFLDLDDSQIKSKAKREARTRACQLISDLQDKIISKDGGPWQPNYKDIIKLLSSITMCRIELLKFKGR